MLPIFTIVFFLAAAAILGAKEWHKKATKYLLITIIALIQTALVVFDMFTMKMPKL